MLAPLLTRPLPITYPYPIIHRQSRRPIRQDAYLQGAFIRCWDGPGSQGPSRAFGSSPATEEDMLDNRLTPLLVQDILNGDELISDSYNLKDVDGIVFEADCAMITEGGVSVGTRPASTLE